MKKPIQLTDSGVIFNQEAHEYWLDGRQLSGITGMLQRQLFPNEFDGIPEQTVQAAADYGTQVHESIEQFDSEWVNDGTVEVQDYITLCSENNLTHEKSEYTVTDGSDWASNIDKVYRLSEDTFALGDIKTYGTLNSDKREKARWQLSIYSYLFELQNKKAKVEKLFILHIRNKERKDGTFDRIREIVFLDRIPSTICKELLDTDLRGEKYMNPYDIPQQYKEQEATIRTLIETKAACEARLAEIKTDILNEMELLGVKTWATETMRLTRKLPTTRSTFDLKGFKSDHPELDLRPYEKTSNVSGSLLIAV